MRQEIDKEIKKLLRDNVIRPSTSPYNAPIWIVPKKLNKDGERKYRMVIDYKRLNAVTIANTYPIPDIGTILANLGESNFFTTIDLTSGFHQILMNEKDIEKTAFSTLNGKYEFLRLPFGLKNAPAIFQCMIDDVLKECIGKICYVYIDDIIIFSKSIEEHLSHIKLILSKLSKANLKINLEKTEFLKTEIEYLGFIISGKGIRADPKKIQAIQNTQEPTNLKELKSFLGLASYYRRFIKDFAKVAKPLTLLTSGEHAKTSKNQSKKVPIKFNEYQRKAFNDLKNYLISTDILIFPDFDKPFILTIDASNYALGAVLSQGEIGKDKPITFISRSLNKTEQGYATNEKEMLAIIWALDHLRNYLYGAKKIKIITDHQPLTFSLSNKNYNSKLKRWKARLEEYNYELIYKPGKTNHVADALSRMNISECNPASTLMTQHSAEEDNTDLIICTEAPLNVFKNQVIIIEGEEEDRIYELPHPGYHRKTIIKNFFNAEIIRNIFKNEMRPDIINGLKAPEKLMQLIQEVYKENFNKSLKIRFTQKVVTDLIDEEQILEIIHQEHRKAHRCIKENKEKIIQEYYFPNMNTKIKEVLKNCKICKENKYDRHPTQKELQGTPVPNYPTEIVHIDIMELDGQLFLTSIDKFSKFTKIFPIENKSAVYLKDKVFELIYYYTTPKLLVMDRDKALTSPIITDFLSNLGINIYLTPSSRSEVNGQVERVHSTIQEIIRCIQKEYNLTPIKELAAIATDRYNNTIHSTVKETPANIFFGRKPSNSLEELNKAREETNIRTKDLIERIQQQRLNYENKHREKPKKYKPGDIIYVKAPGRKGKLKQKFIKEIVKDDHRVTITTMTGRKIHKTNIKND